MQLGFAHRAFEAEQQAVIEAGWIVDAVLVEDQGRGQRAELDKPMPIGRVTGEPGDLKPHDDAGLGQRHFADELLETVAGGSGRCGLAEIAVNDAYALGRPTRGDRAMAQSILALRALAVLGDLAQGRLADIEISVAFEVIGGDLQLRHGWVPR